MGEKDTQRRGWLFVFEGIDGSGKTTQVRRAAGVLRERGHSVVEMSEPTDGPYGRQVRLLAREGGRRASPAEELELFVRDRSENVEHHIRPALDRGDLILLDRYYFSTMAYQGARGIDPEAIRRSNESFAPRPDLVLYFAIDVADAFARIERDRAGAMDLFERRDYLARVKAIYDDLAQRMDFFRTIDARADIETVARRTLEAIDARMAEQDRRPDPPLP